MRIKPIGKIVLFLVLGVLAFFAIKKYFPSGSSGDTSVITGSDTSVVAPRDETTQGAPSNSGPANTGHRSFNYTPEKPVNGVLRGVVEVGAAWFNSFVINMDKEKRWEIVSKDFGESLAYEGLISTDDIRAGLKKYLVGMFQKGVDKSDMHFVISSGALKVPKTTLIANELKKIGYVVNTVTPDQEAKFALRATIPPSYVESSFMTDIGSGNTKVSWNDGSSLKALEVPGAKYYELKREDAAVYDEVKEKLARVPENKRNVCFIIGGVPFSLAKTTRQGEERYTVLNAPDSYKATDKKMAAGINIYKAIAEATKSDTFVFDWDANFTIGFLLMLP